MTPIEVEIKDAQDVIKALEGLSEELKRKAILAGLRAAAKPVADRMKTLAPGRFKRAINVLQFSKRQGDRLRGVLSRVRIPSDAQAMIIGPNRKVDGVRVSSLSHLVEFKTKPHLIKRAGVTRFGSEFASGEIRHPGTRARPFMSTALQQTDVNFQRYFFQGLSSHLEKLARKAATV